MSEINPYRINTDAKTVAVNSHPELAPHCQRFAMEFWEFLIQKEGDRSWLPLESPRVEILEGRYRVVARTSRVNTPVEIRIAHDAIAEDPPKRRIQKRAGHTNPEGLIVVIPFTRLLPGIWELRCTSDLMADMMGQGWVNGVQLQVTTHEIATHGDWEPDWHASTDATGSVAPEPFQAEADDAPVASVEETAPLPLVTPMEATNHLQTADASLPVAGADTTPAADAEAITEPERDRSPIATDDTLHATADSGIEKPDFPAVPVHIALLDCRLVLAQEAYVVEHQQSLVLQGHLESDANDAIEATDAELMVCLRDPQTAQTVMETGYAIAIAALPCPIQVSVTVPAHESTRLLLGELVVRILSPLGDVTRLASQSFTVAVDVGELLEAIAEPTEDADPVYAPLEFLKPEDTSLNLEFLELLDAPRQIVQFQPSKKGTLPPQIYAGSSSTSRPKPLDLPFSNTSRSVLGVSPEFDSAIREAIAATPSLSAAASPTISPESPPPVESVSPALEEAATADLLIDVPDEPTPQERLASFPPIPESQPLELAGLDDQAEWPDAALEDTEAPLNAEEQADWLDGIELEEPIADHDAAALEDAAEPFSLESLVPSDLSGEASLESLPISDEIDDVDIAAFVDELLDGPELPWDDERSPTNPPELIEEPVPGEPGSLPAPQIFAVDDLLDLESDSSQPAQTALFDELPDLEPELQSPSPVVDGLPAVEPEAALLQPPVFDELLDWAADITPTAASRLDKPLEIEPDIQLQMPVSEFLVEADPQPLVADEPLERASTETRSTEHPVGVELPPVPAPLPAPAPTEPPSPEREAFQALNLRQRFWQRLSSMASNTELSGWLRQTSSPTPPLFNDPSLGIDSDLASNEFVVDLDLSSTEAKGGASTSSVPVLPDDAPIPLPTLTVPVGELTAGRSVNITAQLPRVEPRIYIKLWVHDCETRSLLDGPKWLVNFVPTADDQQEAWASVMVPYGCLNIRFEAIAVEMATQRESSKVSVTREVVPPDLPDLSLDLPNDFDL